MKSFVLSLVLSLVFSVASASWAATKSCEMEIGGMSCESCSSKISEGLKKLPEVASADVDHVAGKAKITFKEGKNLSDAKLAEAVTKMGFTPGKVVSSK